MQKILENLAATAELMGQQISPVALSIMAEDLKQYPIEIVIEACACLRRESKGRFSIAAIIEKVEALEPNGRPGSDEAWAMIPRDEFMSVVLSDEIQSALHIAQPLLNEGDQVAARMAFKQAYERIVAENKRAGVKPVWYPSLGWNKDGREAVLAEAVRLGRISPEHAIGLTNPESVVPMLETAGEDKLALEYKPVSNEQALSNLAKLKLMLAKKPIGEIA